MRRLFSILKFLVFWKFLVIADSAYLLIEPSFLLVEEDWQVGTNLPITLCPKNVKILSGDPSNYFSVVKINETCSTLKLNNALDADKENADGLRGQSFSIVVSGPKKSRANLEIQVVDVNDNPPEFYNTLSTVEVSENAEINSEVFQIFTKDPDTGISGISRFSVEGDDYFTVDKRKCGNGKCSSILRIAKKLDYETKQVHTFSIVAKDGDPHSNRTHTVTHMVTVHVKNEKDSPPIFSTDFTTPFKILPTAQIGDVIATVSTRDGDSLGGKVKYTMNPESENFEIDETSGEVKLKAIPGFEAKTVEITATSESGIAKTEEMTFQVSDGGENMILQKPDSQLCEFPIYEARLIEGNGTFEGPVIIKIIRNSADDIKLIGGTESFEIVQVGENILELKVTDSERVASQNLDNAQLLLKSSSGQCRIILRSTPAQKSTIIPPQQASKTISDLVQGPKFEKESYQLEVAENQEPGYIGSVKASGGSDLDYKLLGNDSDLKYFKIMESTGDVHSLKAIDREEIARFDFVVRVEDSTGASTKVPLVIRVKDENDNSPIFEKESYLLTIDEGKSEKVRILASDLDEGPNSDLTFTIVDKEKVELPIDISSDGVLFIGAIDRETLPGSEVNITIKAEDHGVPPRSSLATVTIRVRDINDHSPIFSNSRYSIVLDANISPGGVVGKVLAEDGDATSPNNYVRYSSQDPKFKISDEGEIVFVGPGTLSKDSYFEFNVTATDGGEPPNSAQSVIVLNEHKSALQNELTTQINSNDTMEKTEIKWLNAGMPGYSYEIIRATANGFEDSEVMKWVGIDKKSGRIETLAHIDPDKVKQVKLYISMRKGKREVPVELIINIVDTDEVVPSYPKASVTRIFSTSESSTVGTVVATFPAEGVTPEDGVEYTIFTGKSSKLRINGKAEVFIAKQLDFEKEKKIKGVVKAKVGENVAEMKFELTILDANDNRPIFKNGSVFTVSINEDSVLGTVLDLPYPLAVDQDSGKFAQLRYSMTGDEGFFKIDEANSTIRLVAPLDFETQRIHSLSIKCVDNNGQVPHHEVFASITILVIDVNDNTPVIHNTDLTHLNIGEDAAEGTVVTVLIISDADNGGKLDGIHVDCNSTMFRIDDNFRLVTASKLNGYAGQRMCSTITVKDPKKVATSPYCITVYPAKNTHHNPLVISPKQNSIHYFDENIVYDELLRVKVLEEEGETVNVTFKLDEMFKKDWMMFHIGEVNGSLKAKQPFDFEKKTVHEIKILACRVDNCTSTHLFISVNDRNDNCPMFPKQDVRLTVLENEKGRRQVGRIPTALDSDFHSDNTKVCYTTDTPIFFFSDPTLPVLYTNSSFDREHKKQHQITITAYDCHLSCRDPHKPTNGTIVALIDVLDVNDNFPRFSEKMYHTTIVQGHVTSGSHILTVTASDADEEVDGLKYSIRGFIRSPSQTFTPSDSPITIDKSNGEISANELLKDSSYSFTVVVVDSAGHEDTTTVMISVVTYAQQTELVFDAPFELIIKNEKKIGDNLSNATGLQTIVDKCRQNSNFTLMLVHFVDRDGQFVNVDRAVNLLMTSPEESRRELRSVYGLREAFPPVPIPSRMPQIAAISVLVFFIIFVLSLCIWCRQKNNYERKLRHISAQASTVHTVTLGRPAGQKMSNPAYGEIPVARHHPAPPPPLPTTLQSTEL